jgi:hypothetical protein
MLLTVSTARSELMDIVAGGNESEQNFLPLLNQVQERYFSMGRWPGMQVAIDYSAHNGYITLPRYAGSLLGGRLNGTPAPLFGRLHEFALNGPGTGDTTYTVKMFMDMGSGFCTMVDLPKPSRLKLMSSEDENANAGIRISSADTEGPIFSRPTTAKIAVGETTTATYSSITRIVKPITRGYLTLYAVDPDTLVETALSVYEPGELNPDYRRYRILGIDNDKSITVLCKRQYVPSLADTDQVYPPVIGALKHGLIALNYENNGDIERANASWSLGLNLLQGALREERGGAMITAQKMRLGVGRLRGTL